MTLASLVLGGRATIREATIYTRIDANLDTAIILEGLPDGHSDLDALAPNTKLKIARIAPGCMCCTGNMIMRVTLNRMLRDKPARLYISVANSEHIAQLRLFLTQAPYDSLLTLTDDIVCDNAAPR
ncbi:GTP-binding protein [Herminiimonas arsenitoxidans]|uniref:GTP-binding protein n=1 Tax=Herminiimonas arsenitoxidans TaxID=1809410 RepID=UPI000970D775|nr:GTP-binding protein [Herminiimonas arsenitoxidans]